MRIFLARAPRSWAAVCALALGACATHYDLTLMPNNSGKLIHGTATSLNNGEASVTITTAERIYTGNWIEVTPSYLTDTVGASAWGWRGWAPFGQMQTSPGNSSAKALLQAEDGAGMRCDFFGLTGGQGTGKCYDDQGLVYDVQIRSRNLK